MGPRGPLRRGAGGFGGSGRNSGTPPVVFAQVPGVGHVELPRAFHVEWGPWHVEWDGWGPRQALLS